MKIGEFANAAAVPQDDSWIPSAPLYWLYEAGYAALNPARAVAAAGRMFYNSPANPASYSHFGKTMAAGFEMFERMTRRYAKPDWGIDSTLIDGQRVEVSIETVWEKPFCRLLHFVRNVPRASAATHPKLFIVAPMSGHYATLLRGTVKAFLPTHDVYITDWTDARMVPLAQGTFDLDDYIDYVIDMLHVLGSDTHVIAVCQPSVPVLAAIAVMEEQHDPIVPRSMILMGGPIDTRMHPTAVNRLAEERGMDWFRNHVITKVPLPHPGVMRDVYPGFLQLNGFMSMNLERHVEAHRDMFLHLVAGDGESAQKKREFYDEYLAVMDLTAEFYLQTVDTVFVRHALPKGEMTHRDMPVDPARITRVALMTVEGEKDDISGIGQTEAAHRLCVNIPQTHKMHYLAPGVGHYGVFNGSRFRAQIVPRICAFIDAIDAQMTKTDARQNTQPIITASKNEIASHNNGSGKDQGKTSGKASGKTSSKASSKASTKTSIKSRRPPILLQ